MNAALLFLLLAQRPQFGGPTRDFQVADAPTLASSWPPEGPKKLWVRDLGPGFSGIAVSSGRLFRFDLGVRQIVGKRLTWAEVTGKVEDRTADVN